MLRGRRGARITALTSGGTIPDTADYQVVLEPENQVIGTVNEDFAVESLAGDVFQLGNAAYRIRRVERGTVRVEDAQGQPPNIPFWLGEAPGRTDELSQAVSRLRRRSTVGSRQPPPQPSPAAGEGAARRLPKLAAATPSPACGGGLGWGLDAPAWLAAQPGIGEPAARQLAEYLAAGHAALGVLPTHDTIVFERFFDEAGGMQLVIHSPYGSRLNRAWGLALRKRFCRKFNFELQAAATEDNIVLSLTTAHSFDLAEVPQLPAPGDRARRADPGAARRADVHDALALGGRGRAGAAALPRRPQGAAAARAHGRRGPDRGDLPGPARLRRKPRRRRARSRIIRWSARRSPIASNEVDGHRRAGASARRASGPARSQVVARDLTEPSPLALEVLSARPYAYLDDAPLEERRTQAVMGRRWMAPEDAAELGRLDPDAIARVREEAWPDAANRDELHDGLAWLGFLTEAEAAAGAGWREWLAELAREKRATQLHRTSPAKRVPPADCRRADPAFAGMATAVGRRRAAAAVSRAVARRAARSADRRAGAACRAALVGRRGAGRNSARPARRSRPGRRGRAGRAARPRARRHRRRARLVAGPRGSRCAAASRLASQTDEWCERRLLARIHRYTLKRLRAEIEPVAARDFLRFLFAWQRVTRRRPAWKGRTRSPRCSASSKGFEAPAGAWETEILPARIAGYEPAWLDDQCLAGRIAWARLRPRNSRPASAAPAKRVRRAGADDADHVAGAPARAAVDRAVADARSGAGQRRAPAPSPISSATHGASFFDELVDGTRLLRPQIEEALAELVALGLVSSDSFAGLRALLMPADKRRSAAGGRALFGMEDSGRWALARRARPAPDIRTRRRGRRAPRAHAAAPLRRRVLAAARTRGRLAAAVARPAARLSPARSARRNPRRPLRRRVFGRAVRAAGGGRHAARDPAQAGRRRHSCRCPAPTR